MEEAEQNVFSNALIFFVDIHVTLTGWRYVMQAINIEEHGNLQRMVHHVDKFRHDLAKY
jgi:hypothetical protein